MNTFDAQPVFVSSSRQDDHMMDLDGVEREGVIDMHIYKNKFKEFIREFRYENFDYTYRDQLKKNYNSGRYWIEVNIDDLSTFDTDLLDQITRKPIPFIQKFEEAAKEIVDEVTAPRPPDQEHVEDIQVMVISNNNPESLRHLNSSKVSKLIKVSGIVLNASAVRSKTVKMSLMCRSCRSVLPNITVKKGLDGYSLPRKCNSGAAVSGTSQLKCPLDPYFILPDKCTCVDFQMLKLQEPPDSVPSGEMPRHLQLYCDRFLCERAVPGNKVEVTGVYTLRRMAAPASKKVSNKSAGVQVPYFQVLGIQINLDGDGRSSKVSYTREEEDQFRKLANSPDCYERIARSIAPSIYGAEDMKKAIACLLFGGSRKRMPDGLTRRGDINILLLGDPGTAKSQLLKFVESVAPIAVYTSGKGSSAAGLTASVIRDPATKNFVMEGGAMVLADGGVVCIDEFDKMREDDRVAIHEAMEQQTISIAKAGITTTLNSRCAVLAAANSIFGRWDDTKGDENIDFMPTILSRFDMIFIVKDEHTQAKDMTLAKHVMRVHVNAFELDKQHEKQGELSLTFLKKYFVYCRSRCGPRLSVEAAEKLKNHYVLMRKGNKDQEVEADKKSPIPITVRQLEAIVRIAESLAKMQLKPFATEAHVDEALRLFQASTLDAAGNGNLSGVEGFTTKEDFELLNRIETQLKRRLAIGSQVSEYTVVQDFLRQKYPEHAVMKVIYALIRRGELQHRLQRKMLYRLK